MVYLLLLENWYNKISNTKASAYLSVNIPILQEKYILYIIYFNFEREVMTMNLFSLKGKNAVLLGGGGVLGEECSKILKNFFKELRKRKE